jgi:hypothetical protein
MREHAALLRKARQRLVEDHRSKIIAAPFEREKTRDDREKFVDIATISFVSIRRSGQRRNGRECDQEALGDW